MPNIRLSQLMLSFFAVTVVACGGAPPPDDAVSDPLAETVATEPTPPPYRVYVTNESSGDLTVIAGGTHEVLATVPLGKRPRGLAVSPDGRQLFVALSGSPPAPPGVDESTLPPPDRAADGIGVVDVATQRVMTVIQAGTDPEQVALDLDGTRLYVANEDAGTTSVVDIETGEIISTLKVGDEPEGVTTSPDGRFVYVTSEQDNQVSVIDVATNEVIEQNRGWPPSPSRGLFPRQQPSLRQFRERRLAVDHRHHVSRGGRLGRRARDSLATDGRRRVARREPGIRLDRARRHRRRRGHRARRRPGHRHRWSASMGDRAESRRFAAVFRERPLKRCVGGRHGDDDRRGHDSCRRRPLGRRGHR